ncbi:MAG: 2Fe-2S iron-sulfur cluster binding domain-containing protein [Nitrospinae bacterium]|nr:2Fe-2S iron-sulfur cluster binding domain-containing protein [Nitrospinota bacterium]
MTSLILILAVGLTAFSLHGTRKVEAETRALEEKIKGLDEAVKKTPFRLRRKLNRLLLLENGRGPFPTVTFAKSGKSARVFFPWETIFSIAQEEGMGLTGTCEGNGDCGLCAISVVSGEDHLSPKSREEEDLMKKMELPAGARLSCQSRATGDIVVDFIQY